MQQDSLLNPLNPESISRLGRKLAEVQAGMFLDRLRQHGHQIDTPQQEAAWLKYASDLVATLPE